LADEPTAHLDKENTQMVIDLLDEVHSQGKTIIVASHHPLIIERAQRVINLEYGRVVHDSATQRYSEKD
jgi:putative ABC transport system ATP-binding protein